MARPRCTWDLQSHTQLVICSAMQVEEDAAEALEGEAVEVELEVELEASEEE